MITEHSPTTSNSAWLRWTRALRRSLQPKVTVIGRDERIAKDLKPRMLEKAWNHRKFIERKMGGVVYIQELPWYRR